MAKTALPKEQARTGKAESAPNPLCALLKAAAKAGAAGKRSAPRQPLAVHICLCQHCHRMLQRGNPLQFVPQPLSVKDNLLQLSDQDFSLAAQQNYHCTDQSLQLRLGCLWIPCPATLPCTECCLDSIPTPFPPYGLSSLPLPPCSGAFPTEACRETSLHPSLRRALQAQLFVWGHGGSPWLVLIRRGTSALVVLRARGQQAGAAQDSFHLQSSPKEDLGIF